MKVLAKQCTQQYSIRLLFSILCAVLLIPAYAQNTIQSLLPGCSTKSTGTGNTTGNIGNMQIANNSNKTIIAQLPPLLIPSDGEHQAYLLPNKTNINIKPNATATVPLYGFCTDITKPPVPKDAPLVPEITWVLIDPSKPIGTNTTPHRATDMSSNSPYAVRLIYNNFNAISHAYDSLHNISGLITTPFSGEPSKEREAVIQQTFWIYNSQLNGTGYNKEKFKTVTSKQYEQQTGKPLDKQDTKTRSDIDKGVDQFWSTFELVGQVAKVLPSGTEAVPIKNEETGCKSKEEVSKPVYNLDIQVADAWGDAADRKKIKDDTKAELAKGVGVTILKDKNGHTYNMSQPPATAYAFWENNHIGGYASAYAKTKFIRKNWKSDWVWSTQKMDVKAGGSKTLTLSMGGNGCTSFIVGTSFARVKATSEVFDPISGDEDFLTAVNFLGKIAMDIAIAKGKGEFKGLSEFLKDKIKDDIKGMGEDALLNKISEIIGFDLSQFKVEEPEIEPLTLASQASDVYANANGKLDIKVGKNSGTAAANSKAVYKREKLEKSKDAVSGGVPMCKETIVSDGQPGSLTAKVSGNVDMSAKAEGNGYARADLESIWAVAMVGICKCGNKWIWDGLSDAGYYVKDAETMDNNDINEVSDIVDNIGRQLEAGTLATEQQAVQKALDEAMIKWWNNKREVWKSCK